MCEGEAKPTPDPENVRAEYQAVVDYHTSIVNTRFTIAGLYVAGIAFLTAAVFSNDTSWPVRAASSFLGFWLTLCLWVLELRSRALFTNLAHRGIEIEHEHFGLVGDDWLKGFFSRQYKEPPGHNYQDPTHVIQRRLIPDRPVLGWAKRPMSERLARFISHSLGLDLLYAGGLVFWYSALLVSLWFLAWSWQ